MSGSSRLKVPSHLTYRNQSEEVAMQSRSNCQMEKSLTSTAKQFQESQQQNEGFSTMETSSSSSPDSSECFILEDEKGSTPIMEIDNQKEPQSCSDKSITVPQNFYKDVMYELVKLRQELEAERGKTHILESKISRQSQKIKNLKVKTHSKQDTLKTPPIRLKIEAVTKGKYISSLDDSDSSSACSPNYSGDDAEEIEPELYDESPTEDAALSPNGLRLQTSTLNSRTNVNKTQIPATNCEIKQLSGRQGSKEKSLKKHNLPAFDDPVSCAKNKPTDNSLRKRKVRQGQLQTNSENSLKRMKNSSVVGAFSSNSEIKSTEGVKAGILDTGIKPQQQTESTTYTKEVEIVDERTGFILKGTECISVTEDLSVEDTLFDTARRSFNELFSEITQDGVNSKTNGHIDQPYSDNGNHCFSRNATTDSNVSRNPDKQRQISERRSTKKLTKLVKRDGYLLPSSNLVPVGERHTLHESGSYKHAEHEANKIAGRNEHVRNQLNVGLVDDDCIPSETWSRNQGFTEIGSCNKIKTLKTSGDLLHQSCSVLIDKNHSLHEPRLRDCETWPQVTEMKISNNLKQKFAEMSKCNSNPLSINCTKEDGVLSTMSSRTKSITPVCKTKNPNKSSLDYSYCCNLCGLKFCGMESLQCHIPCVGSVTNKDPLKCGVCSKTFRESVVLERHLQGLASNKLLECEICSKICASKSCLAFHMKIHIDIGSEKCVNQSNTLLPKESQASQRSSECTVCNKRFFSKRCLQSHLKQHQENERKLPSRVSVDCHPENLVMLEKRSDSKGPRNRSFQDALNMNRLLTTDLVSNQAGSQEQNSAQHCDRERSSWSIFNQDRLLCDSGNSLPIDHNQDKTNHQQNLTSVSIFDRMSSKIPSCQRESMELICAQEIGSNIRKTYRPYCVKCWDTFTDLQALEEHAKVCKEFSRESSPRETIPIRINDCIVTKSEDWLQSSECVMEIGSEEKTLQSFEAVADNYQSVDVAKSNTFQELGINSNMSVTSKVHDCVDEEAKYGIDEVANCQSHDWAKNSLEGVARREPNDRASMLHVLAKNAADDLANSESDDLQESFSDDIANIESYLANSESHIIDLNVSGKLANGKLDDLAEHLSDDLRKNGSDELVEDGSTQMTRSVSCKVTKDPRSKLISSGSHEFLTSGLTDLSKLRSHGVTKNSSHTVNFVKSEVSNCSSDDALHCLDCCKIFSCHQKLKKHLELHKLFGTSLHGSRCKQKFTVLDSKQEHTCQAYSIMGPQFRCPECHESFKISQRFKKHMSEVHSMDQHFKCKQCGKQYDRFCKWNEHVQAHRTDRHYVCNKCGKRFKHLHHLKSGHLPCLSDYTELKCPKCNNVFEQASRLRRHLTLCQNARAVKCLVCHRFFLNQLKLDKHMGCHSDEKPYLCLQCDKCFIFREDLIRHVHDHSVETSYVCVVCNKAFGGKASLLSHLKIHTISWKNCSLGSKISGMSSDVEMKGVEKQTAKRFYGCGLCGCLYIGMVSLKRHLPCEGGASEDPFFCGDCNEKFVDANELEKHVLGVHSKNFFICSICNKMFVKKLYLKQHIMDSHTDEKPYKCKQCGREFKHSLQLRYHLPCYVSPGSDIQCNLCPMTFCKISQLRTHISVNHNSKAVQCDVCAKILRDRQALDVHLKIHANNRRKPYSCTHCSKSFFHTSSLRRHIETVHLDPLKCDAEIKNVNCKYQSHISPSTAGTDDTLCCLNCFKTFSSHQELNKHMEQHKQFGSSLRCSRCKQKFSLLDSIQGHTCQAYTIEGPQFRCPECEECFEISWQFKNHVSEVHSMEQHFKCKHCGKQYDKFCQWNSHVQAHRTDRRYVCNKCGKSFKHLHHLRSDHLPCLSNSAALKCPKCSQGFARASRLRRHARLCQNEPAVKCLVCHQLFNNQSKLDEHKCCHTNEKPYRCLHCDMCFSRREDLLSHAAGLHSAEDDLSQTYVCDVCGKSFSAKTAFQKHLKSHMYVNGKCSLGIKVIGASNKVQCDVCGKTFPSNHVLDIHLKSHANESKNDRKKPYSCRQCSKCFVHSSSLSRHLETAHLDTLKCDDANNNFHSRYQYDAYSITGPQFRCPECEESFEISQKLKKHMSEVHSVEQHFKCKRCGKQYEKFCQWNSHVQAHRTDRHYVCKKCGKKYKYLHHLKRDHLPCLSDSTELKCPKCNEVFRKATQLRYHLTLCQNVRAVKCQVCQRLFHNQKKLDKHMRSHTGEKPYQCPQCDKCFSARVNLTTHIQRHSDVRPYVCDVCGKAFATETFLRNHSRIHTTDLPYKCNECDKSFLYECLLRNHKSKIHKGVKKRFACGICNKTFCSKMYLNTHMCSHTGQNPFLCSICGKGFPAKILLKYHLRVHTGEKPYACKYCYRRFSMPRSMRNHERVHTGEKPYECTICGMKFPQSNYLKNHSKKAHTAE